MAETLTMDYNREHGLEVRLGRQQQRHTCLLGVLACTVATCHMLLPSSSRQTSHAHVHAQNTPVLGHAWRCAPALRCICGHNAACTCAFSRCTKAWLLAHMCALPSSLHCAPPWVLSPPLRLARNPARPCPPPWSAQVRIVRIFNTYGPRMALDDGRVVSNFVSQALTGQPITVYGEGTQTRSFQYVEDLVKGLVTVMDGPHIGPFNVGNPGEFTMMELAKLVKEVVNPDAVIEYRENTADDPGRRKPDITKIKTQLGWEPKIALREGLLLMMDDFKKRLNVA